MRRSVLKGNCGRKIAVFGRPTSVLTWSSLKSSSGPSRLRAGPGNNSRTGWPWPTLTAGGEGNEKQKGVYRNCLPGEVRVRGKYLSLSGEVPGYRAHGAEDRLRLPRQAVSQARPNPAQVL